MLSRINWLVIVAVTLAAFALLFWVALAFDGRAQAQGYHCWALDGCVSHRHSYRQYRDPDVHVHYYRTPDDRELDRGRFECLDKVRGLGTQWIGEAGALEAAKKDWMERVRYDHGEKFIDFNNARDVITACSRVSIGEVVGQVTYRCDVWAMPCRPYLHETPEAQAKDQARQERQDDLVEKKIERDVGRQQ